MTMTLAPETYRFSLASLARTGVDRARVEDWFETFSSRVTGGGMTYDNLIDEMDGATWLVGRERCEVELPSTYSDPIFLKLRSILRSVLRQLRD